MGQPTCHFDVGDRWLHPSRTKQGIIGRILFGDLGFRYGAFCKRAPEALQAGPAHSIFFLVLETSQGAGTGDRTHNRFVASAPL